MKWPIVFQSKNWNYFFKFNKRYKWKENSHIFFSSKWPLPLQNTSLAAADALIPKFSQISLCFAFNAARTKLQLFPNHCKWFCSLINRWCNLQIYSASIIQYYLLSSVSTQWSNSVSIIYCETGKPWPEWCGRTEMLKANKSWRWQQTFCLFSF